MDRIRLLTIQLPPVNSICISSENPKAKISFVRRLALGFIILAGLGLLYVPAYHSAQGQFYNLGETPSPVGSLDDRHFIASIVQLRGWSYNITRDVSMYIHPENTTVILNPKSVCSDTSYLLILICSAVANLNARLAIRNTWGNQSNLDTLYGSSVKVVFLLGQSDNETLNSYVLDESNLYNDIIQENFHDTYNNLTLKSVMLLKWVKINCDKTTYFMKTDDDMFVNIPILMNALKRRSKSNETLIGSLICNARPITDPKNKWYTPKYMFSERTYPNYLSGTGYVMSLDVVLRLYKAALSIPLLHLEDVYITGLCAKSAGLKPVNHYGFSYVPRKLEACLLRDVITAHKINASSMYTVWNRLNDSTIVCGNHSSAKKTLVVSRIGRNIGYFFLNSQMHNRKCV